jgi:hypothetical protein
MEPTAQTSLVNIGTWVTAGKDILVGLSAVVAAFFAYRGLSAWRKELKGKSEYKDKIRLLISLYKKGVLSNGDISKLRGHLAYVKNVDSVFYTKLQNSNFKSIHELESGF